MITHERVLHLIEAEQQHQRRLVIERRLLTTLGISSAVSLVLIVLAVL